MVGEKDQEVPIAWQSTDESCIVTMMPDRTAMALAAGDVMILASLGALEILVMLNAGDRTSEVVTERAGSFRGRSNYTVRETCAGGTWAIAWKIEVC